MTHRKLLLSAVIVWLALTLWLLLWAAGTASAAASPAGDDFSVLLREALRTDPDLVLDVLRENSEVVLDIAQQGSNQRRRKSLIKQWKLDMETPKKVDISQRPIRGAVDAPVTIVAFSDFTCPYCEQAAGTVRKLLKDHAGKVRYVFKHFPLEDRGAARLAAEYHVAAGLQDAEKSWKFYDLLFSRREDVLNDGEAAIKRAALDAGLDVRRLSTDARSRRVREIIEEDMAEAARLGIQGTPHFLVNDLMVRGALAPDLFSEAVMMALDNAPGGKRHP